MRAGNRLWEKSFVFNLFRQATNKMSSIFLNVFPESSLSPAMKGMASLPQSGAYNQEAFRYLLESETKRSERSGYFCQILLVHRTNAQGVVVQMDSHIAKEVMAALSRSLRETDYIGWYRDGYIVGAVLTVLVQEPMAQVASNPQKRLVEILRAKLGVEETSCLQVRVCQHHELEDIESGEGTFAEN
ncbi:MAG TPA: hypothetical protein VGQ08_03530 [Nitrospiraceae bacterium]|jgi:hypothetical protein|nr:hypothetical protein [Nitrospiraceae bacterium]